MAYRGLSIKGADVVSDAGFYAAWRRVHRLLHNNPVILENLLRAGSEIHIIGKPAGRPIYGGSNEDDYLAEMAMWYVGGRGDWPRACRP